MDGSLISWSRASRRALETISAVIGSSSANGRKSRAPVLRADRNDADGATGTAGSAITSPASWRGLLVTGERGRHRVAPLTGRLLFVAEIAAQFDGGQAVH